MIRKAQLSDIKLLQEIGITTFTNTFDGTCTKEDMKQVVARYFNTEQCTIELQNTNDNFFFYEDNLMVQGYMRINDIQACPLVEFKAQKCMELVRLYVLKAYHGTGVANSLMQYAINFAKEKDYDILYLSVWEYNFRARGFYEKHGFTNTGIMYDFPLGKTMQKDFWFIKKLK